MCVSCYPLDASNQPLVPPAGGLLAYRLRLYQAHNKPYLFEFRGLTGPPRTLGKYTSATALYIYSGGARPNRLMFVGELSPLVAHSGVCQADQECEIWEEVWGQCLRTLPWPDDPPWLRDPPSRLLESPALRQPDRCRTVRRVKVRG